MFLDCLRRLATSRLAPLAAIALSAAVAACGETVDPGDGTGNPKPTSVPVETETPSTAIPQPLTHTVTPGAVAVGDEITLLGENFISEPLGFSLVHLTGTLTTRDGVDHDVDFEVIPDFVRASVLRFRVQGLAPPAGMAHDTGFFNGNLTVTNVSRDGVEQVPSAETPVEMELLPSLIFERLRPVGSDCNAPVERTLEGKRLELSVRATGLAEPKQDAPIRFTYVFMQAGSDISLGDAFALSGSTEVPGPINQASENVVVVSDLRTDGPVSRLDNNFYNQFWEDGFLTGAVPAEGVSYFTSIFVRAEDTNGKIIEARHDFEVTREIAASYDGASRVVRTFDPVPVSGCLPGGPRGVSVSYSENESESRSRSYKVGASVSVGADIIKKVLDARFGFNVGGSVSSGQSVGESLSLSGRVLPGQFGVFYRQASQLVRTGAVVRNGVCGNQQSLGEVEVTDWSWAPDLAFSNTGDCPPYPPSNLPPGDVFE